MAALLRATQDMARLYGYRPVETPAFEHTEVFERSSGETSDVVTKEMYTFDDKGKRSMTLRPEGTAPVVRAWIAHRQELPNPFKASYTGQFWRHGRPQAGRLREFHQWGVEVIGTDAPEADVEVIVLGFTFLRERGLERLRLRLNSIGDDTCRPAYRQTLHTFLEGHRDALCEDDRVRMDTNPLRAFDCKEPECIAVMLDAPVITDHLCQDCADRFARVKAGLDAAEVPFELDSRLVRGLDYYTRTVFEIESETLNPSQASVCSGGRYDGLAQLLGGPATPGVGFGLGLERTLLAIDAEGVGIRPFGPPTCFVVSLGEGAREAAAKLVRTLRREGIAALSSFEERPMKAQLKMADRSGAAFAAIVGEREIEDRIVTMRRLSDGEQNAVDLWEVPSWISLRA